MATSATLTIVERLTTYGEMRRQPEPPRRTRAAVSPAADASAYITSSQAMPS